MAEEEEDIRTGGNPFEDDEENETEVTIEDLTTNLTERAKNGLVDPLIGRTSELKSVVEILARRRKILPKPNGKNCHSRKRHRCPAGKARLPYPRKKQSRTQGPPRIQSTPQASHRTPATRDSHPGQRWQCSARQSPRPFYPGHHQGRRLYRT